MSSRGFALQGASRRVAQALLAWLCAWIGEVSLAGAQSFVGRAELLALREELQREHDYPEGEFDALFAQVRRLDRVIALMDAPLRAPTPWHLYWPRHIGGDRFERGQAFLSRHAEHFARAEATYGVPRSVIAAIIGVETVFGRITGSTRVIDALATLAFDYPRRAEFFRGELKEFLLLARELGRSPLDFYGSFAGALGWPQFMPGSYRRFAVDFDRDGRIDLWDSPADIIGSVASFLVAHGWQRGEPVMLPIHEPPPEVRALFDGGLTARRPWSEWQRLGVSVRARDAGVRPPHEHDVLGLIALERADGRLDYWLAFENFYVITRYNRSRLYASAVWSLAYAFERARRP
ncbi:MAG: lytic murein transglycosylase B [Casimicrobiaceae bacterium]|nr:lytic murein transglycosylase B [Casimicrobiaceae bacterium]MDW8311268.1 lytic murein transglycosylase B [Burkholderiales bacterium]